MDESDSGPVTVPPQVACELETLKQMGTHDLASAEVLDGLAEYDFHAARQWIVEHPDEYMRAVREGSPAEGDPGAADD